MGSQAYEVICIGNPDATVRSEQHFLDGWRPGTDSARSLSMAVRLRGVPAMPTSAGGGWIAQLHGEGIPFVLKWEARPGVGYFLMAGVKYDEKRPDGTFDVRQPYFYEVPLTPGTWNRMMIQIDLRRSGTGECPDTIGDDAFVSVSRMDNATGQWGETGTWTDRIGHRWDHATGGCVATADLTYNFKIGQYVVRTTNRLDYDNVSYGKRCSSSASTRSGASSRATSTTSVSSTTR